MVTASGTLDFSGPSNHLFLLKNGSVNTTVNWGTGTDIPLTGDWNGDGLWDVGVFRSSNHTFYLKNGTINTTIVWGLGTDKPLAGDWNDDGLWEVGLRRNATFILKMEPVTPYLISAWLPISRLPASGESIRRLPTLPAHRSWARSR